MIKIKRKVRTKRNLTSSNLSKNIIRKRNQRFSILIMIQVLYMNLAIALFFTAN